MTITRRGETIATIVTEGMAAKDGSMLNNPAFGMWKDREDMRDPVECVRSIRKPNFHNL